MPGWLPAQPRALRKRRLFSAPDWLFTTTYDADSFGKTCQRSDGVQKLRTAMPSA